MELDDLLDSAPNFEASNDIDDILGDMSPANENPTTPSETLHSEVNIPVLRRVSDSNPHPTRVHVVSISHFKHPPPHVKTYVTNACYYANQILLITSAVNREKRGIVINENNIYIMTYDARVVQTIPITQVDAIIMQDVMTAKALGLTKELQSHVVLQLRDLPDLFFVLSEDKKKNPATGRPYGESIPPLDIVLRELLLSYEVDLPVCRLADSESINYFVKKNVTDQLMRHECARALAYRASLTDTLRLLARRHTQLTSARDEIEASSASPVITSLLREIEGIEEKKKEITLALRQTEVSINKCGEKEKELRASIRALEEERHATAREKVAEREGAAVARQAVDFNLMQQTHQTEMRNLNLLCTFLQTRAERRRKFPAVAASDIEADVAELKRLQQAVASRKDVAMDNLTEAKKRLCDAKAALQKVSDEVTTLRRLPQGAEIPSGFKRDAAPTFLPVYLPDDELCGQNTSVNTTNASQRGKTTASGKESKVVLSDDDSDIDVLPPQQQSSKQKTSIVLVDDDDL